MDAIRNLLAGVLEASVMVLALASLVGVIAVVVVYIIDVCQTQQAVRRNWVDRACKKVDSVLAFGSTKPVEEPGQILFLNSLFLALESEAQIAEREPIVCADNHARGPCITLSFFNTSAMSCDTERLSDDTLPDAATLLQHRTLAETA